MQMMGPGGPMRPGLGVQPTGLQGLGLQDAGQQARPQADAPPPPPPGAPPGQLTITRGQMAFQLGQMLRAQVADQPEDGLLTLKFGDKFMTAATDLALVAGDQVLLRVESQDDDKVNLSVVRQESFSEMSEGDLSSALMDMKMPLDEGNMQLAKGMVEMGMPLTPQDFAEMQKALAQMPNSSPDDISSAGFLKMAQMPMTPENISTLSNFLSQNPMIGAQLFEVSQTLKKLGKELDARLVPKDLADLLAKVPGLAGEMGLTPGRPAKRKPSQNLHNMAFQAGIERMGPHVSDDEEWDLVKLMRKLYEGLDGVQGAALNPEGVALAQGLMKDVEQNLQAQQLINRAEAEKMTGLYYMQVPIRFRNEDTTAQIRLEFQRNNRGEPVVDAQNLRVEFSVHTAALGQVSYLLTVVKGQVDLLTQSEDAATRDLIELSLPHLVHRLGALGYQVTAMHAKLAEAEQSPITPVVQKQTFEKMERINIKA